MDLDASLPDDPGILSDPESRSTDDHGSLSDNEPCPNADHGLRMDSDPSPSVDPSPILDNEPAIPQSHEEPMRCINCGADVTQRRRHNLELIQVQTVIRQWIAPQLIDDSSVCCHSCWTVALHQSRTNMSNEEPTTSTGHSRNVCVNCGCSLLRIRSHRLHTDTERESRIRNVIMEQISPRQLRGSDQICHPCWQRADRAATHAAEPQQAHDGTRIHLPLYSRASDTQSHCFFPECNSTQRLAVPIWLRVKLFSEYKFYVPQNCRICVFHLHNDNWEVLSDIPQPIHSFNADHIQDFASFVNERPLMLDFSEVERMSDELLHYWVGLTKAKFEQLYSELPRLGAMRNGKLALGAYLLKLRTGDSDKRISTLLNISRSKLMRLMGKARNILNEDFVSRYLGTDNITRAEISQRNLLIPNGLFGGVDRKPIVIIDGTYLFVQKSSNYMYQKDTYSLHKSESEYKNRSAAAACLESESEYSSEDNTCPPKKTTKGSGSSKAKVTKKKIRAESDCKKRNAAAADLGSDSEYSSDEEEDLSPSKKTKASSQSKIKAAKKETSKKKAGKNSKTLSGIYEELFGDACEPAPKHQPLWSSLSRRVAGGISRQGTLQADGDVYIDLRVFDIAQINWRQPERALRQVERLSESPAEPRRAVMGRY
ncbi:uncharacterized protein LOC135086302 [Ostrinia nubilalis]|uniref:uncharacterized protein LOC135086302 n=1 Tax=Ostrinia nubilalis TaxID=29057 RepID=UPI00308246E0